MMLTVLNNIAYSCSLLVVNTCLVLSVSKKIQIQKLAYFRG